MSTWCVPRADTVVVTKRTVTLALAASLAALVLSACVGASDTPGSNAAAEPAPGQYLADPEWTATPPDAVDGVPDAEQTSLADSLPVVAPTPLAAATPAPPRRVVNTITRTISIDYATRTVRDSSLPKGKSKTVTAGRDGVRTLTYRVTLTNGKQTAKKLVKSVVTRKPVTKVVAIGTKTSSGCDPNYRGRCVPIASDVDCAGGSGDGPAYVDGPVQVVGADIYRLDRDGDGVACDS